MPVYEKKFEMRSSDIVESMTPDSFLPLPSSASEQGATPMTPKAHFQRIGKSLQLTPLPPPASSSALNTIAPITDATLPASAPNFSSIPDNHPFSDTEIELKLRHSRSIIDDFSAAVAPVSGNVVLERNSQAPFSDTEMDYSTPKRKLDVIGPPPGPIPELKPIAPALVNAVAPQLRELGEFDLELAICQEEWTADV